jgi:Mrp family chromosome partitioning ATPase
VSRSSLAQATRIVQPTDPLARGSARLAVLPSGGPRPDPASLLTSDLVASLFDQIGELDYEWVLVDAPPLLGTVDARALAGAADGLLLVTRLGAVTVDQLLEERDTLDRLEVGALGVVVIGSRPEGFAYDGRQPAASDPSCAARRR